MKVSIITVVYNSETTIEAAIQSVLSQRYQNIEYIVIDGNSSDSTLEIIETYNSSISKVLSEPDKGLYDAMNKGLKLATGDIVGFLNSDDFYNSPDVISSVVKTFILSNSDSVFADLLYVDPVNPDRVVRKWTSGQYIRTAFLYGWMPPHPTFFVKRELYQKLGGFNLNFKTSADYEFMLRYLYKHNISSAYLPQVIVRMRLGGVSNSSLRHRFHANKEDSLAWRINGLTPYFFTTWLKPIRKIPQYIFKF